MKKALSLVLVFLVLVSLFSGCEKKNEESIKLSTLSDYSIIYPADWTDWELEDVNVLKNTIEKISGKEIKLVPDTEEPTGKEIILASSSRKTKYDEKIAAFDNAMCYLVGVDGENIVLGGQNFYSDMRAIYDFVNNYLGYDDLEDKYSDMKKTVAGETVTLWERPSFHIMGSNFSCDAYTEAWQIRDFVDCNFNMFMALFYSYNEEEPAKDVAKWCARFGIEMVYYPDIDWNAMTIMLPEDEGFIDNPALWGFYVTDEPWEDNTCEAYRQILENSKEKYKDTGWKFYVNTALNSAEDKWRQYFEDSDVFSFDWYINNFKNRGDNVCQTWEKYRDLSYDLNQDYFIFIDSWNLVNRGGNTTKMFRSHMYLAMIFDADAVEYFQYGDCSQNYFREGDWTKGSLINYDFTKNSYWFDAQKANAEIYKIKDILDDYKYLGAFTDKYPMENFKKLDHPYDFSAVIPEMKTSNDESYLAGCFEANDGNSYAMLLMNINKLDDYIYDEIEIVEDLNMILATDGKTQYIVPLPDPIQMKINGSKLTCYRDAEPTVLTPKEDGYYSIKCANGDCLLFVIEK